MKKILITCDFCGKSIENSSADIDFVAFNDESERIKTGDICESCKNKISEFLENLKKENPLNKEFTKEEAIEMMGKGIKMTHRYFDSEEWITIDENDKIETEEGYKVHQKIFWEDRTVIGWETGWKIFKN